MIIDAFQLGVLLDMASSATDMLDSKERKNPFQ